MGFGFRVGFGFVGVLGSAFRVEVYTSPAVPALGNVWALCLLTHLAGISYEKRFKSKTFLAMKFITQHVLD